MRNEYSTHRLPMRLTGCRLVAEVVGVSTRNRRLEGSDAYASLVMPGLLYQEALDGYIGPTYEATLVLGVGLGGDEEMKMKRTSFLWRDELADRTQRYAAANGISQSDVIRWALSEKMAGPVTSLESASFEELLNEVERRLPPQNTSPRRPTGQAAALSS